MSTTLRLSLMLSLLWAGPAAAEGLSAGGGYFGEVAAHPGAYLVIDRALLVGDRSALFAAADLGGYWHPRSQLALFSDLRAGWRRCGDGAFSFEVSAGLGYLHSFVAAETVNFKNTGYPGLMPVLDLGFLGWDLEPTLGRPLQLKSSLRVFGQYPVNTHWVLHPAVTATILREF